MGFKIDSDSYMKQRVIKNLLNAHKRIADNGNASDVIKLSKFILHLSKHFKNETFDFWLENDSDCTDCPPDKCEESIP